MQINQEFNKMIDSCGEKITGDELSFLAGYAEGLVRGVAQSDSINYVAAKRFLKVFESAVEYGKKLQNEENAEDILRQFKDYNKHKNDIIVTEYYSKHKVGNTSAMLYDAINNIQHNYNVIFITEDTLSSISNKLDIIFENNKQFVGTNNNFKIIEYKHQNVSEIIKKIEDIIYYAHWRTDTIVYVDGINELLIEEFKYELRRSIIIKKINIMKSYSNVLNDEDIFNSFDKKTINIVYTYYDSDEDGLYFNCIHNVDNFGNQLYHSEIYLKSNIYENKRES